MFFTRVGQVVAWVLFVFAAFRIGAALAFAVFDDFRELARRYLGTDTTGEAIDRSLPVLAFAIGLGILVEISKTLVERTAAGR